MRVVAIVGPSHAGKTTLLNKLFGDLAKWGFESVPELVDLDDELGPGYRSDATKAVDLVRSRADRSRGFLLVDVGAGQVVQDYFRNFLRSEPGLVPVAVWCDEQTFLSRHSAETREREFLNNYGPELRALWQTCRQLGRLVDTSAPITIEQSLASLLRILQAAMD